ncbi:MAG: metal ABC transporter ATP-binding protein [Parachlamydiales bacterium]|nr:metal ABC transporter ATP-binding protein [Verrucomicrobiota bacterium]MBX3719134.1 metal ABC transporter ATP-binding protein [Candidatus Acheromyda pituitae]
MSEKKKSSALRVDQLTVNYDKTPVLWDVHFEIPEGKLVGIIGPNGAGKSTLLKSLLGMTKPLSGVIEFYGKPFKKVRNQIAYVPQRSSVDWDFPITAFDLVLMGRYGKLGYFKWAKASDKEAARRALDMVGMLAFADRQISQLSGGQQQRLFIARALLQDADFYLMDEPFAGVDMATEKAIIGLMDALKAEGKTLCVVHHDLGTVDTYFDWVIMLNTCLIASGPVAEVFHKETIMRTYGRGANLLDEAVKLTQNKSSGFTR